MSKIRGNCYVASEALFHLLGGKKAGWKPMHVRTSTDVHWFLINEKTGQRLDATAVQFQGTGERPNYDKAVGCGFLTKKPSKRAVSLMKRIVWQLQST